MLYDTNNYNTVHTYVRHSMRLMTFLVNSNPDSRPRDCVNIEEKIISIHQNLFKFHVWFYYNIQICQFSLNLKEKDYLRHFRSVSFNSILFIYDLHLPNLLYFALLFRSIRYYESVMWYSVIRYVTLSK